MTSYDVLVIGNDRGGVAAAQMAAAGGLSVAVVAQNFDRGGVVLTAANAVATQVSAGEVSQPEAWPRFHHQCRERSEQAQLADMKALSTAGVVCHVGVGQIVAPGRVRIETSSRTWEVMAKKVILASGSRPRALVGAPGDDRVIAAEKINSLAKCPSSALVVGDTVQAYEAAWALQTLGCQVTWVFFAEHPLSGFEEADFQYAISELGSIGVKIRSRSKVRSVDVVADELKIVVDDRSDGRRHEVLVSYLVTAIGRRPHSASLDLKNLKIVLDKRGHIQVDQSMLTGEPNVYAVGDLLPTLPWPHVAAAEGRVAARHLLGEPIDAIRYQHIPLIARAWPSLCAIGLTSHEAQNEGFLVHKVEKPIADFVRPGKKGRASGRVTIVFDKEAQRVLGVHICGDHLRVLLSAVIEVLELPKTLLVEDLEDRDAVEFAAKVMRRSIK